MMLICLLVGCHRQPVAIAVIPRTTDTLLWESMHLGVAEAARGTGLHVYWNAPDDEAYTEKQISLYSSVRAAGYRGIIFAPIDTLAARSIVLDTVRSGVPVVIVDDELGPPPSRYLSYVSNDEAAGALIAAQRIAYILHGHGKIGIMGTDSRSLGSLSREEHLEKALVAEAPGIKIVVRRLGDSVITHEQEIAREIMSGREPVDVLVALSGAATRGAYFAKVAISPRRDIPIVGFDQDILIPLRTGEIDSVIIQNAQEIGRIAMLNLKGELHGEQVKGLTLIPPLLLTRANLDSPQMMRLWQSPQYRWDKM